MPTKAISAIPLSTFLFLQGLFVTLPSMAQDAGKEGSKPQITAESAELHLGRGYEAMRNATARPFKNFAPRWPSIQHS
jgi:hypothetical protein